MPDTEHHPCYSGLQVQGTADSPAARYSKYTYFSVFCQEVRANFFLTIYVQFTLPDQPSHLR